MDNTSDNTNAGGKATPEYLKNHVFFWLKEYFKVLEIRYKMSYSEKFLNVIFGSLKRRTFFGKI